MDTLVTADWLSEHLDDPDLVILDCTVTTIVHEDGGYHNDSGRPEYDLGHIPGAGFADLKGDLCDTNSPVEFALPAPEQFCSVMGALGVGDDSRVVLYDTSYTGWAARVWWMLRWVGFDNAALLDGGITAWTSQGWSLSTEPVVRPARQLTPRPRPEVIASEEEVLASIDGESVCLIDTLPSEFYRGEMSIYSRPGHIPGAINIDGLKLVDANGKFLPQQELAKLHDIDPDSRIITYCGGGIVASANAFILTRLGFNNVAVYTDSLQVWTLNPDNPMALAG